MTYRSVNEVTEAVRAYLDEGWNSLSDEERATMLALKWSIPDSIENSTTEEDE